MKKIILLLLLVCFAGCSSDDFKLPPNQLEVKFKSDNDKKELEEIGFSFNEFIGKLACEDYINSELGMYNLVKIRNQVYSDAILAGNPLSFVKEAVKMGAEEGVTGSISEEWTYYVNKNNCHICKFFITNIDIDHESAWLSDHEWYEIEIEFETINENVITLEMSNTLGPSKWLLEEADSKQSVIIEEIDSGSIAPKISKLW